MSLHHLGATRSRRAPDHLLQTPDTFVWAPLLDMERATACMHASPQLGAGFAQYTVALEAGGSWQSSATNSRFVYVLEGEVRDTGSNAATLTQDGYWYVPPSVPLQIQTDAGARIVVIEKPYEALPDFPAPATIQGYANAVSSTPLLGDTTIQVRALLPLEAGFDMAVNTMTYQPGARLGMVEVHVMEHGLLMLEGEGIYRLGDAWYPVAAGDFIWMAPFCPQWFGALGSTPAKYLIYKDWNRSPFAAAAE